MTANSDDYGKHTEPKNPLGADLLGINARYRAGCEYPYVGISRRRIMTIGLLVRIDEDVVGRLWLDAKKRFCFQYDKEWLEQSRIPLSLSLPLRAAPYSDDESHPFFANLLPEEKIRAVIAPVRFHSIPSQESRNVNPAPIASSRWMNSAPLSANS